MSPNLRIAFRFLTAKKRAMAMSLSCIILGVGLFIVTQATTSGFQNFFIQTILGTDGAIRIQDKIQATQRSTAAGGGDTGFRVANNEGLKFIEGIDEPDVKKLIQSFPEVTGISEIVKGSATIRSSFKKETIQVFGVRLDEHLKVSALGNQIVEGSLAGFSAKPSGALLGREMADRLDLKVDDSFQLETEGQIRRYKVSAIYETGYSETDRFRLYLNMSEARSLLKKPTGATYLQADVADKNRAEEVASHIQDVSGYVAKPWQEQQKTWLGVFKALRVSTGITVSVFTLIAGLAMFNTLAMIVLEKTKEIAILRSMGYTRDDISRIFLWQAAIVLGIGTVLGAIVGAGVTGIVSTLPLHITGIFKTETFIVFWSPWHYVEAIATAVVMVMVASLVPSRRAARLEPGDIIRGTAQ